MAITIEQFSARDWRMLRDLHLRALRADPGVFGSSYAKEVKYSPRRWRIYLASRDNAVWGVFDDGKPVGMTGINMDRHDPTRRRAILSGPWLDPAYRGRGLARKMFQTRVSWALRHPYCEIIVVSHRAGNAASQAAALRQGFTFTHAMPKHWPDGATADNVFYKLVLNEEVWDAGKP